MNKRTLVFRIFVGILLLIAMCCGALYLLSRIAIANPAAILWVLVGIWCLAPLAAAAAYLQFNKSMAKRHAKIAYAKITTDGQTWHEFTWVIDEKQEPELIPENEQ
jgi:hypothetical protein